MKKRVIGMILTTVMATSLFAGCTGSSEAKKLYIGFGGLSVYSNFDERENTGGSVETVASIVMFDGEGKILDVNTDSYEIRKAFVAMEDGSIKIKEEGKDKTIGAFPHIKEDNPDSLYTKYEVGDDYGIDNIEGNSGIDWFEQLKSIEDQMVGRTVDEVMNANYAQRDDQTKSPLYPLASVNIGTENDVVSGASIYIDTHVQTIIEAWDNRIEVEGYSAKDADKLSVGLGMTGELDAQNKIYNSVFAGSLFDGDKVVYTALDSVEIPYTIKEYNGYKLVMVDSNKYQTRKTSFNGIDAGYIETMRDLNIEKDGVYYSILTPATGEGMKLTDNKYKGNVHITAKNVFMENENSPIKAYDEFENNTIGKTIEEISEDSIMKEALTYSKVNAEDTER